MEFVTTEKTGNLEKEKTHLLELLEGLGYKTTTSDKGNIITMREGDKEDSLSGPATRLTLGHLLHAIETNYTFAAGVVPGRMIRSGDTWEYFNATINVNDGGGFFVTVVTEEGAADITLTSQIRVVLEMDGNMQNIVRNRQWWDVANDGIGMVNYYILKDTSLPQEVKIAALMHHEKFDGKGYPLGKGADHIDEVTAIVSICDIYEAMTADRVYRARESPFSILAELQQGRFGSLHAGYTAIFMEKMADSFLGNTVVLSNGEQGRVVHLNRQNLSRPLIQCGDKFIDLSTEENINISAVL